MSSSSNQSLAQRQIQPLFTDSDFLPNNRGLKPQYEGEVIITEFKSPLLSLRPQLSTASP